jgi:hypothetical protein
MRAHITGKGGCVCRPMVEPVETDPADFDRLNQRGCAPLVDHPTSVE